MCHFCLTIERYPSNSDDIQINLIIEQINEHGPHHALPKRNSNCYQSSCVAEVGKMDLLGICRSGAFRELDWQLNFKYCPTNAMKWKMDSRVGMGAASEINVTLQQVAVPEMWFLSAGKREHCLQCLFEWNQLGTLSNLMVDSFCSNSLTALKLSSSLFFINVHSVV